MQPPLSCRTVRIHPCLKEERMTTNRRIFIFQRRLKRGRPRCRVGQTFPNLTPMRSRIHDRGGTNGE